MSDVLLAALICRHTCLLSEIGIFHGDPLRAGTSLQVPRGIREEGMWLAPS